MAEENLVEGWTEPIVETLMADGVVQPLGGFQVTILIYDKNGTPVEYGGSAAIQSAVDGTVVFNPAPGDLVAASSPYSVRWKVADGNGKIIFWPSGPGGNAYPLTWNVFKP